MWSKEDNNKQLQHKKIRGKRYTFKLDKMNIATPELEIMKWYILTMSLIRTCGLWCMFFNFWGLMRERIDFYQHLKILMSNKSYINSNMYGWVLLVKCNGCFGFWGFCLQFVGLGVLASLFFSPKFGLRKYFW